MLRESLDARNYKFGNAISNRKPSYAPSMDCDSDSMLSQLLRADRTGSIFCGAGDQAQAAASFMPNQLALATRR